MMNAVEGIFNEGKVILSENINFKGRAKVLVVFLEDVYPNKAKKERLFGTFGSWSDNRSSEQIIEDIYKSRVTRKEDIQFM
jgi:hypothetical protein